MATEVDPQILLVDEILAVGDIGFQEKCFERIRRFRESGKTIIMVTHDMDNVQTHCERAILIDHGSILVDGNAGRSHRRLHEPDERGGCRRPLWVRLTMHVVFVLPRFFPYRGGYENSLLALAKYMVSARPSGHRIHHRGQRSGSLLAARVPTFPAGNRSSSTA